MTDPICRDCRSRGFSLTELLVVVGIIAVAAAVSLPMIANYLKHYKIKGASQQVAGEIQEARAKAINKNVNLGVVFVTTDSTHYRWIIEDDQTPSNGVNPVRQPLSSLVTDPSQAGPDNVLPSGIVFTQTCPSPAPTGGAWEQGFRFNRLGGWCSPGDTNCPALDHGQNFIFNATTGATSGVESAGAIVCIVETSSGLGRKVFVRPGGRVMAQQ